MPGLGARYPAPFGTAGPVYPGRIVVAALEPCSPVTTTWTWQSAAGSKPGPVSQEVAAVLGGTMAVSSELPRTMTPVAARPPKVTDETGPPATKPLPYTTTRLPPETGPP